MTLQEGEWNTAKIRTLIECALSVVLQLLTVLRSGKQIGYKPICVTTVVKLHYTTKTNMVSNG